jgi:hypothetical protein
MGRPVTILLKAIILLSALLLCIYYLATTNEFLDEQIGSVIRKRTNEADGVLLAEEAPIQHGEFFVDFFGEVRAGVELEF